MESMPGIIVSLSIGFIFVVMVLIMKRYPPKDRLGFYGYRTPRSRKNQQLWDAANRYSNEIMFQNGIIIAVVGVILSLIVKDQNVAIPIVVIMMGILVILMVVRVELLLKKLDSQSENKNPNMRT